MFMLRCWKTDKGKLLFKMLPYILCCIAVASWVCNIRVFGLDPLAGANQAFDTIAVILQPLLTAIGALFILIGVIRYALAHSQEDSPTQQKAAMMIGAGIALVVLGGLSKTIVSGFATLVGVPGMEAV